MVCEWVVRVVLPSTVVVRVVVVVVVMLPLPVTDDRVDECCENDQLWTGRVEEPAGAGVCAVTGFASGVGAWRVDGVAVVAGVLVCGEECRAGGRWVAGRS